MTISDEGLSKIKVHEAFRSSPYLCPAKVPTIGYGNTYYPSGVKVKLTDDTISETDAEEILRAIVASFEKCVNKYVTSDINQNQFDALLSFTYNVGQDAFRKSTLLRKVNRNTNDPSIKKEFLRWNKSKGKVVNGLTNRRKNEADFSNIHTAPDFDDEPHG